MNKDFKQALKSRKFILSVLFFLAATIAMYMGDVEYEQWVNFMKWILGIYAVGNVGEHAAKGITDAVGKKAEKEKEAIKASMAQPNLQKAEPASIRQQKDSITSPNKLKSVSAGDVVEISTGNIYRVSKVTEEMIHVGGEIYHKSDGTGLTNKELKIVKILS